MKLKKYLKTLKISDRQFCLMSGISPSTMSRFLSGSRGLSLSIAYRMSMATHGAVGLVDLVDNKTKVDTLDMLELLSNEYT